MILDVSKKYIQTLRYCSYQLQIYCIILKKASDFYFFKKKQIQVINATFFDVSPHSHSRQEHLCSCLSRQYGIRMSKQSLDEDYRETVSKEVDYEIDREGFRA
ncbi:MAG: hypothetical protein LBG96_03685 [Tannerella sp.]|jgi:hypothetical protein|nr:hypothetical protein [Tannerella sp.]